MMRLFTGKVQQTDWGFSTAIFKNEVFGELWLGEMGLSGDEQASPGIHGGSERALLQYPSIHYAWWQSQFPLKKNMFKPALFGENLSDLRWHEKNVHIGDIFKWGDAIIQVSQPRSPCYKLSARTQCPGLALIMQESARCGWLYRVLQPGTVSAGKPFVFTERVSNLSIHQMMVVMFGSHDVPPSSNPEDWRLLSETEGLSERWQKTLFRRIEHGEIESWRARLDGHNT